MTIVSTSTRSSQNVGSPLLRPNTGLVDRTTVRHDLVDVIKRSVQHVDGVVVITPPSLARGVVQQASIYTAPTWRKTVASKLRQIFRKIEEDELKTTAHITAVIPAHNEEKDIADTLASLLRQTRQIDKIVVVVNGSTDKTAAIVKMFVEAFPDQVSSEVNPSYVTKSGATKEVKSKVAALNYAWRNHIVNIPSEPGVQHYVLSLDADVTLKDNVVGILEGTMIDDLEREEIGGVRAGFGFFIPKDIPLREKLLRAGQAQDFAGSELADQLRSNKVSILGGQATLFKRSALEDVHRLTKGEGPWFTGSLVEDAYLTRQMERAGYKGVVNPKARVMVGAMKTSHAWWNQRRKWQNGHVIDICSDKHFGPDRIRWGQQIAMLFNWLLRVCFFTLLIVSLVSHQFVFNWWWTTPIALASIQGLLVTANMVDRNKWLMIRAFTFVLPELYVWKTLAVSCASTGKAFKAFFGSGRSDQSDWIKQAQAESSKKVGSMVMWMTIIGSVFFPTVILMAVGFTFPQELSQILNLGWKVLAFMSVISSVFMIIKIMRILVNHNRLML